MVVKKVMQVRVLSLFFVSQLLISCAAVQESKQSSINVEKIQQGIVHKEVRVKPKTPLNADLLYNILAGELAGRKGYISQASSFYANAAKQSNDPDLALRAVQIAIYNKDVDTAEAMVGILLKNGRSTAQIHQIALTVYLAAGDINNSVQQVDKLIALSDVPTRNRLLAVGDVIARTANKQVAYSVINGLIEKWPQQAAVYLSQSQIFLRHKDFVRAKQSAEKALQLAPDWSVPYVQLSRVYEGEGDIERSLNILKDASSRFSDNRISMKYGQLLAHNKQYKAAEKQFKSILDKGQKYHEARFSLALIYLKQNNVSGAKQLFTTLHTAGAFPSKSAFYLGRIEFSEGQLNSALSWFSKVGQGGSFVDAQANIAMIKSKQGDLQGARNVAIKLRQTFPAKATQFYVLEGEFLANAQQYSELFELMNAAVKKSPNDLTLRYTRSIAAAELNKIDIVEQDLHIILAKEPNNVNALNALGYTLASKTFRFEEARGYLTKALSFRPSDSAILDSMGWLNYRSGRYEEALVQLEKAYDKQPEAEIALHLGETLWVLGRQREAKKIWQEAIKNHPADKRLAEVLKKIK